MENGDFQKTRSIHNSASDSCLDREMVNVLLSEINDITSDVRSCKNRLTEIERSLAELQETRNNRSKFSLLTRFLKLSNWQPSRQIRKSRLFFHRRRSTSSTLSDDDAFFKTDLNSVIKHELYHLVPKIIVSCCELIEEKSKNQIVGGLYRVPGDYAQIKRLRRKISENNYKCLRDVNSIHTLAGLLKIFFRDVDPPLIKSDEIEQFSGLDSRKWTICLTRARIISMQRFIRTLPDVNRETLRYFICHLKKMCNDYPKSLNATSIAISIGPSILHITAEYRGDIQERLKEYDSLNDYLHFMIDYCDEIFSCNFQSYTL